MRCLSRALVVLVFVSIAGSGRADITGVVEVNLGGDAPAIIGQGFGEDVLAFSDRTHQHNGAAFDAGGVLSVVGANIVPLPPYLVGGDWVRFANNARDNAGYLATLTSDVPSDWYLLVDNRIDGPAGTVGSPNTTDPVLGGTLQWVINFLWTRVSTGISPGGQADYTGVDEGGNGVGAGVGLDQFYSVYTIRRATTVQVSNNGVGASNMVAVVAKPSTPLVRGGCSD